MAPYLQFRTNNAQQSQLLRNALDGRFNTFDCPLSPFHPFRQVALLILSSDTKIDGLFCGCCSSQRGEYTKRRGIHSHSYYSLCPYFYLYGRITPIPREYAAVFGAGLGIWPTPLLWRRLVSSLRNFPSPPSPKKIITQSNGQAAREKDLRCDVFNCFKMSIQKGRKSLPRFLAKIVFRTRVIP